jgi:hypothetical protein
VLLDLPRQLVHGVDGGEVILWELRLSRRLFSVKVRLLVGEPVLLEDACFLSLLCIQMGFGLDRGNTSVTRRLPESTPLVRVGLVLEKRPPPNSSNYIGTVYN